MDPIDDSRKLGSGATATAYRLGDDKIVKVFNPEYGLDAVRYEAFLAGEISKTPVKCPSFHGIVSVGGRDAIVYEYVSGELLTVLLLRTSHPRRIELIRRMARSQMEIHRERCDTITSQADRLSYLIGRSGLEPEKRDSIIALLSAMGAGSSICHGDFHPGNIIVREGTFYAIDWMNCYRGDAAGDVARSYLTLITPYDPFGLPPLKRAIFRAYRRLLGELYLREHLRAGSLDRKALGSWVPIVAAARLADNIPNEEAWLRRLVDAKLRRMRVPGG